MQESPFTPEQFEELLWSAVAWAEAHERRILKEGVPLNPEQMADARAMGVQHPEKVRLLPVVAISRPADPRLSEVAKAAKVINAFTCGLTLRYGIYLRADESCNRFVIAHELAHTSQYERLGGFLPFIRQYVNECLTVGYNDSPLEREAREKAEALREGQG
jgi:hypothetical protein